MTAYDELAKKLMSLILVNLLQKTDYNNQINETESKIPSIIDLATTAALNAIENKTQNPSDLVKKRDYVTKHQTLSVNFHHI